MRPSWRSCNYHHTYPSGSLPQTCLPQASAALVACGLHSSCALESPCLTTGSPSWDLALPKWTQIMPAISVFLTHFCSHIALINRFLSALLLCWRHALRRRSTQGSRRAVKCTRYSKQARGKVYLCKVFWLPWFQVVLIIIVAIIYFYLLITYLIY